VQEMIEAPHENVKMRRIRWHTHLGTYYGTWNFTDGKGRSGTITFGTDLVRNKYNENDYGFTGVFSGQPVKGFYSYVATYVGEPYADLYLDYTYHHHKVELMSNLNIIKSNHMEMIGILRLHHGSTGLHLLYGACHYISCAESRFNLFRVFVAQLKYGSMAKV